MNFKEVELLSSDWEEYELLDSGDRRKLERFGDCVVVRGEPKAWWRPAHPELWGRARARYADCDADGKPQGWSFSGRVEPPVLTCADIRLHTKFMDGSKHLGVFPEQKPHWEFISQSAKGFSPFSENGANVLRPRMLNLFGYTGAASLFAAANGWFVTHVDASKPSVEWARRNQKSSKISENAIRWIVDDALKYVRRLERRGERFEAIALDPPAFGRGPKNELWKLEKMLPELLSCCARLLSARKIFVLMTLYSVDASSVMAANVLDQYFNCGNGAKISAGELVLRPKNGGYPLPLSLWAKAEFQRKK